MHIKSVIELFGKQVNNALNVHKITKKEDKITKNLSFAHLKPVFLLKKSARLSPVCRLSEELGTLSEALR